MGQWTAAAEVARWEFRRYVKPKQQLIGILFTFFAFGSCFAIGRLARDDEDATAREVALIGANVLPLEESSSSTIRFTPHEPDDEATLRDQVREGTLPGLLIVRDVDSAELVLRHPVSWSSDVELALSSARQRHMLARTGLRPESLAVILAPVSAAVTYAEGSEADRRGERLALIIVVSVMLLALFIGMSYVFASITGEKQIRVTEQVVSAISPQSWIDGKLIGLLGVSIVGLVGQFIAFAAIFLVMQRVGDSSAISLPDTFGDPGTVALIVLFAVLGLLFWFTFLAALAATIDDPQHSARGSFLFVPVFATGMAYLVLGNPDGGLSRVLSLLPPTAPSAMPVRLLATDVGVVEVTLSIGLLVGATILLRIAAGRIFSAAMMMYGKEPSWVEMRRWMRL